MSRSLISSAAAGVAVMNGMYMVSEIPTTRSAWGWQMSAPADADFTCEEGEIGCGSMPPACGETGGCCDSNFTCTVTPKAGKTCDVATVNLECSVNGSAAAVPNTVACINIGYGNITKDSELSWSATPSCTAGDANASSSEGSTATVAASEAGSMASVSFGAMLAAAGSFVL